MGREKLCAENCDLSRDLEERLFVRSRAVISRATDGRMLIVPLRAKVGSLASTYSFDATGSLIWELLQAPTRFSELIAGVEREKHVGHEQAEKDVSQFLHDMLTAGLIEVRHNPGMVETDSNSHFAWETTSVR